MAFTRAQASALLNKTEMRLFDDSRANALRGLDRSELDSRITRARASRDRARDLLKRQRGAARTRGGTGRDGVAARTERKEALLVEILGRFTDARKAAPAPAKKVPAKKAATRTAAAKKAPAKKAAATKATGKKAATKKAATKDASATRGATKRAATGTAAKKTAPARTTAKKSTKSAAAGEASPGGKATGKAATKTAATKTAATKKAAPKKAAASRKKATKKSGSTRGGLTPERALEQTRRLLEAKQERDRSPQPWQSLDPSTDHVPQPGFQSGQAARKAQELHDGEARIPSIHGSISTRDRINQGKRDNRGDNE